MGHEIEPRSEQASPSEHLSTPRTDAFAKRCRDEYPVTGDGRCLEFARKLERGRARLVEALREVRLIAEAVDRAGDDAVPAAYRSKTLADAVEVANSILRELGELA